MLELVIFRTAKLRRMILLARVIRYPSAVTWVLRASTTDFALLLLKVPWEDIFEGLAPIQHGSLLVVHYSATRVSASNGSRPRMSSR